VKSRSDWYSNRKGSDWLSRLAIAGPHTIQSRGSDCRSGHVILFNICCLSFADSNQIRSVKNIDPVSFVAVV